MLYDPKWKNAETKADPFSLTSVIGWLEKQPKNKKYVWDDKESSCRGGCLIHQYLRAVGCDPIFDYRSVADLRTTGCSAFFDGDVAMISPFTFGAALKRAHKFAP